MRELLKEFGYILWYVVVFLVIMGVVVGGYMLMARVVYPWWLSIQRTSVESSKSFTDANNNMLEQYKLEYVRLDTKIQQANGDKDLVSAYVAQQGAIIERMCREISTMKVGTVNPNTLAWLNSVGGCR